MPKLAPLTTPDSVSCVPVTFTLLFAPSATLPANELVPVLVVIVPPFTVSGSAVP